MAAVVNGGGRGGGDGGGGYFCDNDSNPALSALRPQDPHRAALRGANDLSACDAERQTRFGGEGQACACLGSILESSGGIFDCVDLRVGGDVSLGGADIFEGSIARCIVKTKYEQRETEP